MFSGHNYSIIMKGMGGGVMTASQQHAVRSDGDKGRRGGGDLRAQASVAWLHSIYYSRCQAVHG